MRVLRSWTSALKLSEKGNEQRSDPVFSCIRSATRTEKYGFGLPHGYAVSASEAFRTVSEGEFSEVGSRPGSIKGAGVPYNPGLHNPTFRFPQELTSLPLSCDQAPPRAYRGSCCAPRSRAPSAALRWRGLPADRKPPPRSARHSPRSETERSVILPGHKRQGY